MANTTNTNDELTPQVPWKLFLITTFESMLAFYIATFCMAMFFFHRSVNWLFPGIVMIALYLFVIFVCGKRVISKLSMATVMLIIPIAPLLALFMVLSLIPVLQYFA